MVGEVRGAREVITGIPIWENLDKLKKVTKGGTVTGIRWLQAYRNGEKVTVRQCCYSSLKRYFQQR